MMMNIKTLFGLAILASVMLLASGCKNRSPDAVCEHYMKIAEEEDEEEKKECVEEIEKLKEEVGDEKYESFADCILEAEDKKTARKCEP